jgi:hypothetical protein
MRMKPCRMVIRDLYISRVGCFNEHMILEKKKKVQSAFGIEGDQMTHPFFFRANIFGSERGAPLALPHRGPSSSVLGTKAPHLSQPWLCFISIR